MMVGRISLMCTIPCPLSMSCGMLPKGKRFFSLHTPMHGSSPTSSAHGPSTRMKVTWHWAATPDMPTPEATPGCCRMMGMMVVGGGCVMATMMIMIHPSPAERLMMMVASPSSSSSTRVVVMVSLLMVVIFGLLHLLLGNIHDLIWDVKELDGVTLDIALGKPNKLCPIR